MDSEFDIKKKKTTDDEGEEEVIDSEKEISPDLLDDDAGLGDEDLNPFGDKWEE